MTTWRAVAITVYIFHDKLSGHWQVTANPNGYPTQMDLNLDEAITRAVRAEFARLAVEKLGEDIDPKKEG